MVPFLVAPAQAAPAFLDLPTGIATAREWIRQAGWEGVKGLVFPETWSRAILSGWITLQGRGFRVGRPTGPRGGSNGWMNCRETVPG